MVRTKKVLVFSAAVLLVCAAGAGLFFQEFDSNVELMLPDDSNVKRSINFFRESDLSNKIVVSLGLNSKEKKRADLFRAADQLTASLISPLFTETDAPWMSPDKEKKNEPAFVVETIGKIAEIKNLSEEEVADQIWQNYQKVFEN